MNSNEFILWLLFLATFKNCKTSLINNSNAIFRIIKGDSNTLLVKTMKKTDLEYPRYRTDYIERIENMWAKYYLCLLKAHNRLIKPEIKRLVEGQNTKLKCRICPKPFQNYDELQWRYKPLLDPEIQNLDILDLARGMTLSPTKALKIYNAIEGFEGVYVCFQGKNVVSVYVLEVSRNDAIEKVKSHNTEIVPVEIESKTFEIYYAWTEWTKCSTCGIIGRRFKYGTCFIKPKKENFAQKCNSIRTNTTSSRSRRNAFQKHYHKHNHKINFKLLEELLLLKNSLQSKAFLNWGVQAIELFERGMPCASRYLPTVVFEKTKKYAPVKVEIQQCLVSCQEYQFFQVYDPSGKLLETANNSAGIYSAYQELPQLPPDVERRSITVEFGTDVLIQCPGTLHENIPITWMIKNQIIFPEVVANASKGRFVVDYVNRIHIKKSRLKDSHIYSCWQKKTLVGTVNLQVEKKFKIGLDHHVALIATIIILGTFLLIGTNMITRTLKGRKE